VITKIRTCEWGINVFHNGVYAYRTRDLLRKLYKTPRNGVRSRSNNLNSNDGDGFHRLCVAMRTDVTMRGNSYNEPNIGDSICRNRYSRVNLRGV